jgi:hypothetical protein
VVETGKVYTFDESTGVYTLAADGASLASVAAGASDCTCSNYLREIEYTVDLEIIKKDDTTYHQIKKITADIVLGSTELTSACSEPKGVNQKFSIFF